MDDTEFRTPSNRGRKNGQLIRGESIYEEEKIEEEKEEDEVPFQLTE